MTDDDPKPRSSQRRIAAPEPHKQRSEMWCTTCLWQAAGGTAETARDHVLDTGHTVIHDYVIRTIFREATP